MRLHVREEARVFAPPFSFLPRNCYKAGEFSCRPSLSPHQGGQKGRLLPHEAPFSFSGRPPPGISRKVFSLASGSTAYPGCCPGLSTAMPRLGRRAGPLRHQFPGRFLRRHHRRSRTGGLPQARGKHAHSNPALSPLAGEHCLPPAVHHSWTTLFGRPNSRTQRDRAAVDPTAGFASSGLHATQFR